MIAIIQLILPGQFNTAADRLPVQLFLSFSYSLSGCIHTSWACGWLILLLLLPPLQSHRSPTAITNLTKPWVFILHKTILTFFVKYCRKDQHCSTGCSSGWLLKKKKYICTHTEWILKVISRVYIKKYFLVNVSVLKQLLLSLHINGETDARKCSFVHGKNHSSHWTASEWS